MKILVVNCGSSSLKYQLMDMAAEEVLAKGLVERIGIEGSVLIHQPGEESKITFEEEIPNHVKAIQLVLHALVHPDHGVVASLEEISASGHRVAHGGERFSDSVLVTADVMRGIEECVELAPLHNPANIAGMNACAELMPGKPQVAVFDTAFHSTIPPYAFLYGLPYEAYEKHHVRRYGFHGTSHKYIAQTAASLLGEHMTNLRIISCHLGNGASVCAIKDGKSIENSMGFTPLEGLVMGTRSGDIDPAIITYLMRKDGKTSEEMADYLNKESGILGISGISSDFRDVENAANEGHERAQLALDVYVHKVRSYIGSYVASMGGVDIIVFTAGLGENSALMRDRICNGLEYLGTRIDAEKNNVRGVAKEISVENSKVKIFTIPTNEELIIARDTKRICSNLV